MATALHFALGPARADKFEEVVRLLLRGSDVNATCEPGQKTPLMLAVENQHLKCAVHILSTRRVNANVADDHGKYVLYNHATGLATDYYRNIALYLNAEE
jgi:ankyrin repeat protein